MNLENKKQYEKKYQREYRLTFANRYSRLKSKAKLRNISLDLTFDQFVEIVKQPCTYGGTTDSQILIGIDRKDNSLGYTIDNSVSCCSRHNMIKNKFLSYDEMMFMVKHCTSISACSNERPQRSRENTC